MQTVVLQGSGGCAPVAPMLFTSQLTLPFLVNSCCLTMVTGVDQAARLGTTEEALGNHCHFHISNNSVMDSVQSQVANILEETPGEDKRYPHLKGSGLRVPLAKNGVLTLD